MVENYGSRTTNGIEHGKLQPLCNFLTVYISEAHAQDEWKLGKPDGVCVNQHKTLEDRIQAAKNFVRDFELPSGEDTSMTIVVDSWENDFDNSFAVWPERAFVVDIDGRLSYISTPTPDGSIDWEEGVLNWLETKFA